MIAFPNEIEKCHLSIILYLSKINKNPFTVLISVRNGNNQKQRTTFNIIYFILIWIKLHSFYTVLTIVRITNKLQSYFHGIYKQWELITLTNKKTKITGILDFEKKLFKICIHYYLLFFLYNT